MTISLVGIIYSENKSENRLGANQPSNGLCIMRIKIQKAKMLFYKEKGDMEETTVHFKLFQVEYFEFLMIQMAVIPSTFFSTIV